MEYNFYLPVVGSQRRGQRNSLRWICSTTKENLHAYLNDRRDENRSRYIVLASNGEVIQDPRQDIVEGDEEELYDSMADYQ